MSTLPMRKSFAFSEQINVRLTPEQKNRIKKLTAQGVEFNDLARTYIERAIEFAEQQLNKVKEEPEAS